MVYTPCSKIIYQIHQGESRDIPYKAGDCLEMGRISYLVGADDYAVDWLRESLRRYALEEQKTADKADILQYYAFAAYKQGLAIYTIC